MLSSNPNPNEGVDNNPTLLSDIGNNIADNNTMAMTRVSGNLHPDQIDKIPIQKHKKQVKCHNEYLTLFDELKLSQEESIFVTTRRFTWSMDTIMSLATIQQ